MIITVVMVIVRSIYGGRRKFAFRFYKKQNPAERVARQPWNRVRWIYFGKPIDLSGYHKEILDDELEIHKLSEKVRQTIQEMVTDTLKTRQSVWWG